MTGPEDIAGLFNDAFQRVWSRNAVAIFKDAAKRIEDGVDVDGKPLKPLSGFTLMRKQLLEKDEGGIGVETGAMLRALKGAVTRLQARRQAGGFAGVQVTVKFGGRKEIQDRLNWFCYGREQARTPGVVGYMRKIVAEAAREEVPDPFPSDPANKYAPAQFSGPPFVQPPRQILGVSRERKNEIAKELGGLVRAAWATAAKNLSKSQRAGYGGHPMAAFDRAARFVTVKVTAPAGQELRNIR